MVLPVRLRLLHQEPAVGHPASRKARLAVPQPPEVLTSGDLRLEQKPMRPQMGQVLMPTTLTGGNQVQPLGKHPSKTLQVYN
jgi:hypothetical protein